MFKCSKGCIFEIIPGLLDVTFWVRMYKDKLVEAFIHVRYFVYIYLLKAASNYTVVPGNGSVIS